MMMHRSIHAVLISWLSGLLLVGCSGQPSVGPGDRSMSVTCSPAWFEKVEQTLTSGDGHGHGPDLGSDEWMSVVEFRLGVRGQSDLPERGSDAWCAAVDRLIAAAGNGE